MIIAAYIPAFFVIFGAFVYALASNAKVAELGRLIFAAAMLVSLLQLGGHVVRLGG